MTPVEREILRANLMFLLACAIAIAVLCASVVVFFWVVEP